MSPDALSFVSDKATIENGEEERGLPAAWERASLAQVASINPPTSFDDLPDDAEVPFIPMAAVAEETGAIDASQRRPLAAVRKGYVRFREGDVIFAKITPCMENGKIAPVRGIDGGYATGSTEFHVLRPGCVDGRYLWYWLVRRAFRGAAQRNMSGSAGQLRVPVDYLRSSPIPLPPMSEQRRIVVRIDELFAEIAEGEAALEHARHGLDTWRRALLKAAVTGELTRDWRAANPPTETGADLLARTRAERNATARRANRGRRIGTFDARDGATLPDLPDGWVSTSVGALFDVYTGSTPSRAEPSYWGGEIPWVSSGEVAFCRIKRTRECVTREGLGNSSNRIHPTGTVLLAMIGEGKTRGQCAILDIAACNNQNAAAIRVSQTGISPEFIYLVLEERYFRSRSESQGGNQPALNAQKVSSIPVPLPPPAEIDEIVRLVGIMRDEAQANEHEYGAVEILRTALRQSVLKAAFEGRLVPQDPADEPASALLARLRGEDAVVGVVPRRRRQARGGAQGALAL